MSTTTSTEGAAVPEPVTRLATLMSSYPRPWALCGGWAIDAWLGRITRNHGDVDLSVFDVDHAQLFDHLAGWQLIPHTAAMDDASALWDGGRLPVPAHIHARSPEDAGPLPADGICMPEKGWWLDIQIDGRDGDMWIKRREPLVRLPLRDAIKLSPWGVPAVVPEALLFFKAIGDVTRRRDHEDFLRSLRRLDPDGRAWLANAIAAIQPDHVWLTQLED